MPRTGGDLVFPLPIALIAALLILSGVSKSGSPTDSEMMSRPCALRSRAFCVTAIVAEGLTRARASAIKGMISKILCVAELGAAHHNETGRGGQPASSPSLGEADHPCLSHRDIRMDKIVALEEQRQVALPRTSISKAIAHVELGLMFAATESGERACRIPGYAKGYVDHTCASLLDEGADQHLGLLHGASPKPRQASHRLIDDDRRNIDLRRLRQSGRKRKTIGLAGDDRDDRRGVNEHQTSPDISSKNALSACRLVSGNVL